MRIILSLIMGLVATFSLYAQEPLPEEELPIVNPIVQLTMDNFEDVVRSKRPIIIDCYTPSCSYCKPMHRVIEEVHAEFGDLYQFCKLNVAKERFFGNLFGLYIFPTIIFIKDGQEVGRLRGYVDKETFVHRMHKFFAE